MMLQLSSVCTDLSWNSLVWCWCFLKSCSTEHWSLALRAGPASGGQGLLFCFLICICICVYKHIHNPRSLLSNSSSLHLNKWNSQHIFTTRGSILSIKKKSNQLFLSCFFFSHTYFSVIYFALKLKDYNIEAQKRVSDNDIWYENHNQALKH